MSAVLVYLDRRTTQVIRVNYNVRLVPASIDETTFIYNDTNNMPREIVDQWAWNKLEFAYHTGKFKEHNNAIDIERVQRLNTVLECIEKFQSMINGVRVNQSPNSMVGANEINSLYQQEIENYNKTGMIGTLLKSKMINGSSVEEVVAMYNIQVDSYKSILTRTETVLNEYLPKIKSSTDPYSVLAELTQKYGVYLK